MKKNRDFHKHCRVVYRAMRKKYGKEKVQDECLRVFKVVFPDLCRLRKIGDKYAMVPESVAHGLEGIFASWHPEGEVAKLTERILSFLRMPIDVRREDLITFYEDIMPVAMRIRKLTPTETGRLMGLQDDEIQKMYDAGLSNSAMYKLHGNSIVVDVLTEIFDKLLIHPEQEREPGMQLTLF